MKLEMEELEVRLRERIAENQDLREKLMRAERCQRCDEKDKEIERLKETVREL